MHRIYMLSEKAQDEAMDWDEAIAAGELETVREYDTIEEAVSDFENDGYDPWIYGVE